VQETQLKRTGMYNFLKLLPPPLPPPGHCTQNERMRQHAVGIKKF